MMSLTRRSFIASLAGALFVPQLALPAPPVDMVPSVGEHLIAFHDSWDYSVIAVKTSVVLYGAHAKTAIQFDPHLWSAVMVQRRIA